MEQLSQSDWLKWVEKRIKYEWYYDIKDRLQLKYLRKKRKIKNWLGDLSIQLYLWNKRRKAKWLKTINPDDYIKEI